MSFLNATWLFGLFSLLVPIILHLQKRKVKTLDWGAVRFLKLSVINRRRGITLEQFLLLFCRCLLLLAFVFTIARPWTDDRSSMFHWAPWLILLVGLGLTVASVTWGKAMLYRILMGGGGLALSLFAGWISWYPIDSTHSLGASSCDVVIIIDGSDSMGTHHQNESMDSESLFANAVKTANNFLDHLPLGSTASFIVVGDDTHSGQSRLRTNKSLIRKEIDSLELPGGANDLPTAIERANSILANGKNPRQQILAITDDQLTNWQSFNTPDELDRDSVKEDSLSTNKKREVGLAAKVLQLPNDRVNLAVTRLGIEDRAWHPGETARVDIEVLNGGTEIADNATLDFYCNEELKQTLMIGSIAPGTRKLLSANIVWDQPGSYSLNARINFEDDLPCDNDFHLAVAVQSAISVLIIDGQDVELMERNSAHYVRMAMNSRLVKLESIALKELSADFDFDRFGTIYLCNVPKLDSSIANSLARYVEEGGGLTVLLGTVCDKSFYNSWLWKSSHVIPIALLDYSDRVQVKEDPIELDWASVQHPALKSWISSGEHDLSEWKINQYWRSSVINSEKNSTDQTCIKYLNGDLFAAEQTLGRGRVIVQTSAPDPHANNFIRRISFPVWHHLLTRYNSLQGVTGLHQNPTSTWIVEIPIAVDHGLREKALTPPPTTVLLRDPKGAERTVPLTRVGRFWRVDLGQACLPGLYTLSDLLGQSLNPTIWRLSIERDASEADLSKASEAQISAIASSMEIKLLTDDSGWIEVATGSALKKEWWYLFAYAALVLLVAESLVLRWLATMRGQTGLLESAIFAPFIGLICWFVWWQGWRITGLLADVQYSNSIVGVAGLVGSLSCIVSATYWDSDSARRVSKLSLMKLVRLSQLGLIGFIILEPLKSKESEIEERSTIAVLWDRSKSMCLSEDGITREEVARQLLWGDEQGRPALLDGISSNHDVQLYQYAASPQFINYESISNVINSKKDKSVDGLQAWNATTNLSEALQRVIADTPREKLSGLVVLSDGCDRSIASPMSAASTLASQKIPVHSIVIGDRKPITDAAIVTAHAPSQIYLNDQVTVNAKLHFDRLEGENATVRFFRDEKLLSTKSISIVSASQGNLVQFEDEPEEIGLHNYRITIDPLTNDRIQENNQRETSVWVTNDRLNLLIVEQRPRWEFRYLKNLFAGRDRNVSLQYVLLSPDRLDGVPDPYPMAASASRAFDDCEANRLPQSELEWLKFDVIVLGDIDPSELNEDTQRSLEKFVSQRGGTLVIISGPNSMPHKYERSPLGKLLPVQISSGGASSSNASYRLRLTSDGPNSLLMHSFSDERTPLDKAPATPWDRLPKLNWRHTYSIAKPGATVLAWAEEAIQPDDSNSNNIAGPKGELERKRALVLWHRYGGGRVLQLNFDQTWRLRYWNGDELHHRFWGRVMRWGTEDRLGLGTELVRLGIDKTRYNIQDPITVKVRLVDDNADLDPSTESVRGLLIRDEELISDLPLEMAEDSGGLLQTRFKLPEVAGRYRVQIVGPTIERLLASENKAGQKVCAEFLVDNHTSDDEATDLVATTAVLGPIAKLTDGLLLDPESAPQLLDKLDSDILERSEQHTEPFWNTWPIVGLFFVLLLGEWVARKKRGFI